MKDHYDYSNAERDDRQDAIERLRIDIEAGWQQAEEGRVSNFNPDAVKQRGRRKLVRLRNTKR
jgi:hypothetical protein